ncbi:Nif3-like dinuclear metal center hexameric protein [Clostridium chauvoei]|uniref:GTP cyclohydrolase 1 type 2 homolog n=2 Tax=Clostridium chauvoei TaxID=46867 RepID=S6EYI0_9CLOT|nr:Nif3-like dinuclear metal center hexameric protein [Clostridium chauvoei]ATD54718.1 Nif3-like dinuclear metal center hexameric protein [Clostridium chauvoei]ATD57600.1 Nif3-like dinuclear metal center hexameric protein [Clostridium chauvoei]MBX7280016.1 Nif3-like dinuclear metal center hexameric protein [Clostridium chauvoei]MBX7282325.1 Nif3-like dinuclear metal center hexameric protein [Clostridium chauvoei]MBX7284907.1 Nif3-like dinuclear metal center hexameric protein [Clostridium chauv
MKKVKDIMSEMEKLAPTYLKEDFDNVGLMLGDKNQEVKKVLVALDCTLEVIEEAKSLKVDMILTHHPLIFRKPNSITTETLLGKKIIELIKNNISLYSSHTNLDSAEEGLNKNIVDMLGFKSDELLEINKKNSNAGLGRVVRLDKEIEVMDLVDIVKEKLNIDNLRISIGNEKIRNIAIINGSGQDFINRAVEKGVNCIITGDTTYHYASDYKEMGVSILDIGHFSSEWLVFLKTIEKVINNFKDVEFITSKIVKDPYTFV